MRSWLLVCFFFVAGNAEETYDTSKFKNIDVDEILNNRRLVNNYFKCLMGNGNCTPEGEELKKILPEAIRTACVKCTEEQIKIAQKVGDRLRRDYKDMWKQLTEKYDAEGIYRKKYRNELKKAGFLDDP